MKRIFCHAVLAFGLLLPIHCIYAQISINATGTLPNSSAMLDVSSTTKGILIPCMTQAQRDAIPDPATGLLIYQTDFPVGVHFNIGTPRSPNWMLVGINAGPWERENVASLPRSGARIEPRPSSIPICLVRGELACCPPREDLLRP